MRVGTKEPTIKNYRVEGSCLNIVVARPLVGTNKDVS